MASSTTFTKIFYPNSGLHLSSYPRLLRLIYSINDKLKADMAPTDASLKNTLRLYDLIGRPLDRIPTVHVGGTNGKGSTSFKISESLRSCGLRTGLFVSPHLASYRERIQVNAELISEEACVRHLPTVLKLCADNSVPATLFEVTFILACLHYAAEECQVVVLEVGMGGELDATNVVHTALSIICSVSLDHTRILGSTVEEIGTKKAGIFKQGVPAIVGPGCPISVMESMSRLRGAPLLTLSKALEKYAEDEGWVYRRVGQGGGEGGRAKVVASVSTLAESDVVPTDTDDLNSRISFAALCMLKSYAMAKNAAAGGATPLSGESKETARAATAGAAAPPATAGAAAAAAATTTATTAGAGAAASAASAAEDQGESSGAALLLPAAHFRAIAAIDVTDERVMSALQSRPPCRWETHDVNVPLASHLVNSESASGGSSSSNNNSSSSSSSSGSSAAAAASSSNSGSSRSSNNSSSSSSSSNNNNNNGISGIREEKIHVVLDMGHNPAAVAAIAQRITEQFSGRNIRVLYGMSRDKDVRTCLRHVLSAVDPNRVHFAQSNYVRAVSKEDLGRMFREETGQEYRHHIDARTVKEMVEKVIALAASEARTDAGSNVVVVCGTGYIMPDARACLGIVEPNDEEDLLRDKAEEEMLPDQDST